MITLETLTPAQKEFLQSADEGNFNPVLEIKIVKRKAKYVEYGNQLCTVKFKHDGVLYKCAYVWEHGPATYDWSGNNASSEDCYVKEVKFQKKKKERKYTRAEMMASFMAGVNYEANAKIDFESFMSDVDKKNSPHF
jgi:hypothetical protein